MSAMTATAATATSPAATSSARCIPSAKAVWACAVTVPPKRTATATDERAGPASAAGKPDRLRWLW